jgi:hypothetical protein
MASPGKLERERDSSQSRKRSMQHVPTADRTMEATYFSSKGSEKDEDEFVSEDMVFLVGAGSRKERVKNTRLDEKIPQRSKPKESKETTQTTEIIQIQWGMIKMSK